MADSRDLTPQRRERDDDRDRERRREKSDKHRSSDDKDRDRDKREKRHRDRDDDRDRDRDRERDRDRDRDRDERRDKEKRDKHRDRDDDASRKDRDRDRDRDRERDERRERDRDRDREERRDKEKRDKHRDRDEERGDRDRDDERRRDRDRDRERERRDEDRDRDRDERRDKEKRDKHRDRDDDRERSDKHRDRDDDRERRRDRDRDRDRDERRDKDKRDKNDSRSHSRTIAVRTVESTAVTSTQNIGSSATTTPVINYNILSSPSTPVPQPSNTFQQSHSQSHSVLLGGGMGVQPSGVFGGGNMFMLGSGTSNNMSTLNSNVSNPKSGSRPTSAAEGIKMIGDDSGSDSERNRKKREARRREEGRGGNEKDIRDKDHKAKSDKKSKHRRSASSSSGSSIDSDGRKKKGGANDSPQAAFKKNPSPNDDSPTNLPITVLTNSYNPITRTMSLQKLLPPAVLQLGYISREKAGLFSSKGDTFNFFLEPSRKFVLAARRRARKKTPNYLISLTSDDLSRDSEKFHGKVRANFAATEYVFYDNGVSPEDYLKEKAALMRTHGNSKTVEPLLPKIRREIGAAIFESPGTNAAPTGGILSNAFKTHTTQPRRIVVLLPAFDPSTSIPTKDWCVMPDHTTQTSVQQQQGQASSSTKKGRKGEESSDDSDDERENQRNINMQQQQATLQNGLGDQQLGNCFSMLIQTYYNHINTRASTGGAKSSLPEYPSDIIVLHNRLPQWNEAAKAFQLNFKGRVGQSSVKNFQLVQLSDGGMSERFPMGSQAPSPDLEASKRVAKEEQLKREKREKEKRDKKKRNARAEMTGLTVQNYSDDEVEVIDDKIKSNSTAKRSSSSSSSSSDLDPRTKTKTGIHTQSLQYPLHEHSPTHGIEKFDPERVVMQFGKRDDKVFSLDFMAPINATQAMCIALTSFDGKVGLE